MENMNKRCPKCSRPVQQIEHRLYRCDWCKMLTDCDPDGEVGYGNPERYAERKEEFQIRQIERLNRQRRR